MLKQYYSEALILLTVAFALFYPPDIGVVVLCASMLTWLVYSGIQAVSQKKNPQVAQFEKDIQDLKNKVELLTLRGNR